MYVNTLSMIRINKVAYLNKKPNNYLKVTLSPKPFPKKVKKRYLK